MARRNVLTRYILVLSLICFPGCASVKDNGHTQRMVSVSGEETAFARKLGASVVVPEHYLADVRKTPASGLVFGKTDFRGILKAAYVRLTIIDRENPGRVYYFYVGSRKNQKLFSWGSGEVIEPGYFSLKLTPGKYKIVAIAIPVVSTLAEEPLSLSMDVSPDSVNYLGTLEVNGIRERAKFGGIPLVKPGFEYTVAIKDEFEAAKANYERLLPQTGLPVVKKLFESD